MSETYRANVTLTNDKTGKRFKAGDEVSASDFPLNVLQHWAKNKVITQIGVTSTSAAIETAGKGKKAKHG